MKDFLQAEVARLEADLAAAKAKLEAFVSDVPSEFHNITAELFHKIAHWFGMDAAPAPAAPVASTVEVTTAPAIAPAPSAPAGTPVDNAAPGLIAMLGETPPSVDAAPAVQAGAPDGYTGHDLTPGHPRINVETAGAYAEYRFTGPGTVYYQVCSGCDSGQRITSYVVDEGGNIVVPTTTYVIANKQPFHVAATGPCRFYVNPEQTGPISVGVE